jgi:ferredoxin
MEGKMKVSVDKELCMGDRNCNMLCPEVFKYDEDELMSIVLLDEIPEHLEDKVNQAVDECPAGAITID